MKYALILIIFCAIVAPAQAVIVNESPRVTAPVAKTRPTQPNYNFPQPSYYQNGKPVYVNTPQPPRKRCKDAYGYPAKCADDQNANKPANNAPANNSSNNSGVPANQN